MAAQFTFVKGKEYKVVNWIDGEIRITTFSAAGRESDVRSENTKSVVMAALVESAHTEALAMNEEMDSRHVDSAAYSAQSAFEALDLFAQWNVVDAAHSEALEIDAILNEHNKEMDQLGFLLNAPAQRRKMIERDHEEALAMDVELSSQDQASKQTVARRNSLSHKIGLAFAGAALLFSGMTRAEVVPSYPVDASRMSLEGSVAVSIDCDAKKVDVLRESTTAAYFSKQVKKQVWNICYGQSGTLDRVYTFVMNKQVGAHDMAVNNSDRHPL